MLSTFSGLFISKCKNGIDLSISQGPDCSYIKSKEYKSIDYVFLSIFISLMIK